MVAQRAVRGAVSGLQSGGERRFALGQRAAAIVQGQLEELLVPLKVRIGLKCLPMKLGGRTEQPCGDGKTLLLIRVEQRIGRASQDRAEFPAEVVRILHARVHALAASGRVNVGGIAGQKDPAYPIAVHHSYIGTVKGEPGCIMQPEIGPSGACIDDLLKALEGGLIRLLRRNLGLKLKRIGGGKRDKGRPIRLHV